MHLFQGPPPINYATHPPLWDPWGLFFIHLTHESEISDLKGMNLGWMNLGWISLYLFLSIKKDEFQGMFFICLQGVNFWQRMDEFKVCFLYVYRVWIFDKEWMNFKVCFSSIYGVWISNKERMNFVVYFSSIYRLAWDCLQLLKMVGKFIGHCFNFPTIYTGKQ